MSIELRSPAAGKLPSPTALVSPPIVSSSGTVSTIGRVAVPWASSQPWIVMPAPLRIVPGCSVSVAPGATMTAPVCQTMPGCGLKSVASVPAAT